MFRSPVTLVAAMLVSGIASADPVLEFTVGTQSFTGRPMAYNDQVCWLAHPDGRLQEVSLPSVSKFRKVSDEFKGLSTLEARNELRRQFGQGWEIVGTGHYLVCAKKGRARVFADHFENLYRSFRSYFGKRGFDLPEPEFPLIAVVFASPREFAEQCKRDSVPFVTGLKGYYHRRSNRISLFEQGENFVLNETDASLDDQTFGNIQASLKDTIVHEATHQVAFNLGLHSRIGDPPRWIVEGLATMFEAEGTRKNTGGKHPKYRVNEERLWWFGSYREERRKPGTLLTVIQKPNPPMAALDFYAEAWALTFFLAESRPREYAQYLRRVADRDPLSTYRAEERLADFQASFGKDINRLEVEMLRFVDDLE